MSEVSVPLSCLNPEDRRGIMERSMVTRLNFLEKQLAATEQSNLKAQSELSEVARYLFPDSDPITWDESDGQTIIAELKRRGIGNGKVGE